MEIDKSTLLVPVVLAATPQREKETSSGMAGAVVLPLAAHKTRARKRAVVREERTAVSCAKDDGRDKRSHADKSDGARDDAAVPPIPGIGDRVAWLAMAAVPGSVSLRPPQLGKRRLASVSPSVPSAPSPGCERRCSERGARGECGKCNRFARDACDGVPCDVKEA